LSSQFSRGPKITFRDPKWGRDLWFEKPCNRRLQTTLFQKRSVKPSTTAAKHFPKTFTNRRRVSFHCVEVHVKN